jgi:ADP-ribose pyrophosphatase YjhB (NUDIX family)
MSSIHVPVEWKECKDYVLASSIMILVKHENSYSVYLTVQKTHPFNLSIPGGLMDCVGPNAKKLHSVRNCPVKRNFRNCHNHRRESPWDAVKRECLEETEMSTDDFKTLAQLKTEIKFDIPSGPGGQLACRMYIWIVPDTQRVLSILRDRTMLPSNTESASVGLFNLATVVQSIENKTNIGSVICGRNYTSCLRYSQMQNFTRLLLKCDGCNRCYPLGSTYCTSCRTML